MLGDSSPLDARPWTRFLLVTLAVLACIALTQATAAPLPLAAVALYQRITPTKSTAHVHRAALLDLVRAEPGVLMGEAATRLGITFHSVQHHARVLQRCRLVDVLKVGRNVALYSPGCVSHQQRAALVQLRRGPQAAMLEIVARNPSLRVGELAALAGCKKSSASAKLKRLRGLGLVTCTEGLHRATALARDTWLLLPGGNRLGEVRDPAASTARHDDPRIQAPSAWIPAEQGGVAAESFAVATTTFEADGQRA